MKNKKATKKLEELEVSGEWKKGPRRKFEVTNSGVILLEDNKPIVEITKCSDGLLIKQTKTTIIKYNEAPKSNSYISVKYEDKESKKA